MPSTKIFGKHDIPKTGQTTSYKTGDDGTYQAGSKANPRFVDNGDGTISDRVTRLMWVKEPQKIIPGASVRADNQMQSAKGDWATSTAYAIGDVVRDAAGVNAVAMNISAATAASPCVLTVDNLQGIKTGQMVLINGIVGDMGTTVLNGNRYYVVVNHTAKTLTLYSNAYCSTVVDTTGKTYTSGGTAIQNKFYVCPVAHNSGVFADNITAGNWRETVWTASAANLTTPSAMAWTPTGGDGDSINNCEALDYAGKQDWRLPNVKELMSIVDYGRYSPAIDPTFFPNTQSLYYWTSTIYANNTAYAWYVHFGYGVVYNSYRYYAYGVRPVRQY